jgi:aspartyl-tRNA(Asn)/glutamyl-tRNA(Gln) amidotransferase subunit A
MMKDYPTVSGSMAYKDYVSDQDDVVVERLKASDSLIHGKTNVPEFGYSGVGHNPVFETTRNPWNTDLTPGGSSAGSVVSTITGMTPYAIASDGGGSIRIPSSLTGTYGLKASMGRVPLWPGTKDERYPGVSSWENLEHIGPVSRTVEDAALMMSVIGSGPDPRDRHSLPGPEFDWLDCVKGDIKGLRVAYSSDWGYAAVDPQVRKAVGAAVKVFESDLGCTVEEAHPGWENPGAAFWPLVMAESDLTGLRKMVKKHGHEMTPHLVELIMRPWTAEEFTDAQMTRKAVNNMMWRFMQDYELLLTPTLAVPAFAVHMQGPEKIENRISGPLDWLSFTFPLNFTGQPAASIPAGFTDDGLPVGLQIIGRHLDDPTVLRASACFEAAHPWADKQPPILGKLGLA